MKKYVKFLCLGLVLANISILNVVAGRGCCSWHGGESSSCTADGRRICNDGTISPSCTCTPSRTTTKKRTTTKRTTTTTTTTKVIRGCTDNNAINYNSSANVSDNSCQYEKEVVETESIPYDTIIESENREGNEIIVQEGKDGSKEVTYQKIIDINGVEISSYKTNETIIEEPINKIIKYEEIKDNGTKLSPTGIFVLLVIYLINYLYTRKEKKVFSILSNIQKIKSPLKILLYILYYLYVTPVIIDFVSISIYFFKKGNKNENRA